MKKIEILLLVLLCTFSLSAQNTNPQREEKSKDKSEISSEKSKKSKKKLAPVITFDMTVYDYGNINKGDDGTCEFVFTNTGKEDLVLTRVFASCGCTNPIWPTDPIPKKKSGVIRVTYDTNRVGGINKNITVESNAENGRVVLKIKGSVSDTPKDAVPENSGSPLVTPR